MVPGCGRGYDVTLFAQLTVKEQKLEKSIGLDISPKAIEKVRKIHQDTYHEHTVQFSLRDFFSETEDWLTEGPFDIVYDYTVSLLFYFRS